MPKFKDITNERYGRTLVKKFAGRDKYGSHLWLCLCDCGNERTVKGSDLSNGKSKSCGCYQRESQSKIKKGVPLPLDRIGGAHTNNFLAKEWLFVNKGRALTLKGRNLNQLIEDNKEFFTEKDLTRYKDNARTCLASLMLSHLHVRRKNGNFPEDWKGWTIG